MASNARRSSSVMSVRLVLRAERIVAGDLAAKVSVVGLDDLAEIVLRRGRQGGLLSTVERGFVREAGLQGLILRELRVGILLGQAAAVGGSCGAWLDAVAGCRADAGGVVLVHPGHAAHAEI